MTTSDFPMGIRCGTVVRADAGAPEYIREILPYGFECFALTFGHMGFDHDLDLGKLADGIREVLDGSGATISAIGVYGNPVATDERGAEVREGWKKLVEFAGRFGTDVVAGFSGAADGEDVPTSVAAVAETFRPIVERAGELGVRIAFENCPMGGTWKRVRANTAINVEAWELLFRALPQDNVGLEWEPCHQMLQLVDVIAQAREWSPRFFHIQGKDATIDRALLAKYGRDGGTRWCWHRTPGFGELDWRDLFTVLRQNDWIGSVAIEGWHDPVYKDELEMTGQVAGLDYLQRCRGGTYVPNP